MNQFPKLLSRLRKGPGLVLHSDVLYDETIKLQFLAGFKSLLAEKVSFAQAMVQSLQRDIGCALLPFT